MEILLSICSKTDGSVREVKCELGERLVVGRGAENGVLLDGPDLSREHLALSTDGTNIYVTDLSVNGTWLNGARLGKSIRKRVRPEDSIEVPGSAITVRTLDAVEPAKSPVIDTPAAISLREVQETPTEEPGKRGGALAPVFHFLASFTFSEKFFVVAGFSGLALLYFYTYG
jgi:pSer/pThr/pTyr-binding forkhead associated (FHA) protein